MKQVCADQPGRSSHPAIRNQPRGKNHDRKADTQNDESEGELDRNRRIEIASRQCYPHRREHRCENDNEDGVKRLEPAGGNLVVERVYDPVGVTAGEQVERGTGLFEAGPEDGCRQKQYEDNEGALLFLAIETGKVKHVGEIDTRHSQDDAGRPSGHDDRVE